MKKIVIILSSIIILLFTILSALDILHVVNADWSRVGLMITAISALLGFIYAYFNKKDNQ